MSLPVWVLLGFASWTLVLLAATVGAHRWVGILTGRDNFATYAEYRIEGPDWYKRALRAHANCVENLPVYGALVLVAVVAGVTNRTLDVLVVTFMALRVCHSMVHVGFRQTNMVVLARSMLFIAQWLCMTAMAATIALAA